LFKTEYSRQLFEILPSVFTSPASIILYLPPSSQQPCAGPTRHPLILSISFYTPHRPLPSYPPPLSHPPPPVPELLARCEMDSGLVLPASGAGSLILIPTPASPFCRPSYPSSPGGAGEARCGVPAFGDWSRRGGAEAQPDDAPVELGRPPGRRLSPLPLPLPADLVRFRAQRCWRCHYRIL
jgi:hypothetical protein